MTSLRHPVAYLHEQLFLLAHDEDHRMRPTVHLPALGVGLAGAALIDLMDAGRVHIPDGPPYGPCVTDLYDRSPATDPVTNHVLQSIRTLDKVPPMPALLRELGADLYDRTLGGLIAQGVIAPQQHWGRTRHHLVRSGTTVYIRAEIRSRVDARSRPNVNTDSLCALIWALNMHDCLFIASRRAEVDELLVTVMQQIPDVAPTGSPLQAIPHIAQSIRLAVGDLATAAF